MWIYKGSMNLKSTDLLVASNTIFEENALINHFNKLAISFVILLTK